MKPNAARAEQPAAGAGTAPAAAALRMIIKRKRGRPRKYLYFADEHVGGATDEGRASRRDSELSQEQRTVSPSRSTAIVEGGFNRSAQFGYLYSRDKHEPERKTLIHPLRLQGIDTISEYENKSTAVMAASRTDQRADGDQWTSNVNGRASPSKQPASVFDQAASSSAEVLTIDQLESSVDEQVSRIDNSSSASEETLSASERLTSCTDEQIVTIDRRALSDGDKQNSVEELSSAEDERVSTVRQVESTIDEEMLTIDHDASTSDERMLDDNVPDESSCISDKPLTPYLKFSTEVLDSVKEQYPHYKMVLVLDRIRTMWEELTPVQKLVYYEESGVEAEKNKLDSTNVLGAPAGALKEYTEVEEIELVSHALTASEGQLVELHSPANGQAQVSTVSTPLATVLAHASVPPQPWIMGVSAMQKVLVFDVIRASNRALSYSEIAKSTGQLWSELTDEEKKPYVDEYEEEKIKYDNERMRMGYRESVDPSVQRATKTVWSREHARHAVVAVGRPPNSGVNQNGSESGWLTSGTENQISCCGGSRTDHVQWMTQWTSKR
ncbi:PREDICTED: uncharacterized protein LOC106808935 [Priapulus caudatus]|uniref:Uncharacterized protein LOC106808935 n=1 Tax=Priapulus caudatus TaxID=37621 RepID=A0ABM1E572_PRICU|nr:PREDICTED: uncharacterized protein LOC106808935 [Priapulus caudatus]